EGVEVVDRDQLAVARRIGRLERDPVGVGDGRILLPQKVVVLPSEPPEGDAESWKQLVLDTEGFFHVVGAPDPVRWSTRRADAEQLVVARSDFVVLHNAVAPARRSDQCGITGGDARSQ